MAEVVLENLCKTYAGAVHAVRQINLSIREREFLVLVGPSGCGKTTTLRMIAGLEEITSGTIRIGGVVVNEVPPKDRDIAMVFQNYALYPHMTVYKNMSFGLKLRGFPRDQIEQRVRDAAELLGIDDLLNRKPKALSGGQKQRVALGRAIVRQPKAFLFDEPLSNLDAKMRVQMRAEISKLHRRLDATMIYVTHDQVEAMTMGDRIVVMKDGVIQQTAPPLELYDRPANRFVAGFIGSPPMNFFSGRLAARDGGLWFEGDGFALRLDDGHAEALRARANRPVVFGVRPEDVGDARERPQAPAHHRFTAQIEVVEPMGADVFLYLATGEAAFIARVKGHDLRAAGSQLEVAVNLAKAHFFDPDTGEVLV